MNKKGNGKVCFFLQVSIFWRNNLKTFFLDICRMAPSKGSKGIGSKKGKNSYRLQYKQNVINYLDDKDLGGGNQKKTANHFNIAQSMVSRWSAERESIFAHPKKRNYSRLVSKVGVTAKSQAAHPEAEVELNKWFAELRLDGKLLFTIC